VKFQIATCLQLESNTRERQLTEVIREHDDLLSSQGQKRRHRVAPQEPTPLDPKYQIAGQRCTLFRMLWVTPDLYEIETDETYSEASQYLESEPAMQLQGECHDMLSSMATDLVQGFNDEEHFRKVVSHQHRF
jgi:hypothetical protein